MDRFVLSRRFVIHPSTTKQHDTIDNRQKTRKRLSSFVHRCQGTWQARQKACAVQGVGQSVLHKNLVVLVSVSQAKSRHSRRSCVYQGVKGVRVKVLSPDIFAVGRRSLKPASRNCACWYSSARSLQQQQHYLAVPHEVLVSWPPLDVNTEHYYWYYILLRWCPVKAVYMSRCVLSTLNRHFNPSTIQVLDDHPIASSTSRCFKAMRRSVSQCGTLRYDAWPPRRHLSVLLQARLPAFSFTLRELGVNLFFLTASNQICPPTLAGITIYTALVAVIT